MTRLFSTALIAIGVALALAAPVCSHAQTPAFDFSTNPLVGLDYTPNTAAHPYNQMGYLFHVGNVGDPNVSVTISSLGFYDASIADKSPVQGLNESHLVGIFKYAGTDPAHPGALVAQATVAAGTAGTLIGNFRYASQLLDGSSNPVNSVTLSTGDYIMQAQSQSDNFYYLIGPTQITSAPNVAFSQSRYGLFPSLTYPVKFGGAAGYFGGNFLITPTAAVPEPGAFGLMGSGLIGAGLMWRKRRAASRRAAL